MASTQTTQGFVFKTLLTNENLLSCSAVGGVELFIVEHACNIIEEDYNGNDVEFGDYSYKAVIDVDGYYLTVWFLISAVNARLSVTYKTKWSSVPSSAVDITLAAYFRSSDNEQYRFAIHIQKSES